MGWFSKKLKVQPPYDVLTVEQQRALYFLLEYFAQFAVVPEYLGYLGAIKSDAINYLKKAAWYLGISKKDIDLLRPYHQDIETLYDIIKGIRTQLALDYMVNNCYNLIILADREHYESSHKAFYGFWKRLGYSGDDIWNITHKYMYRVEI
ncbi:hypothetical protein [Phocaeicola salanitronis]|uniref:hypothetical protein n=1 Tax=Phocaeicola salanitronis TaxID=376805 RepID=UPI0023F7FDB2|nr:hypothetical protein [Phocaeicola salanitronis]